MQYRYFPHKIILEHVMIAPIKVLNQPKSPIESSARAAIEKVHLRRKKDAYPSGLSGRQHQRVAIARSLAMGPEGKFFDEITAALHPEIVKKVLFIIKELTPYGMTCIVVTHEFFGQVL